MWFAGLIKVSFTCIKRGSIKSLGKKMSSRSDVLKVGISRNTSRQQNLKFI